MIWNSFQEVRKELFSYWLQKLVLILQNIVLATLWSSFLSSLPFYLLWVAFPHRWLHLPTTESCGASPTVALKGYVFRLCNKSSLICNSNKKWVRYICLLHQMGLYINVLHVVKIFTVLEEICNVIPWCIMLNFSGKITDILKQRQMVLT